MEIIDGFGTIGLPVVAIAGVAILLFGYRIKKVAFFIAWFILGYLGATFLMPWIAQVAPEVVATELYQTLIPIAGGLLLALLGFSIEKLCVSGICFVLTILVATQYFGTEMQTLAISAVAGVIMAGLAVMMMKPATIVATSGVGAYALVLVIFEMMPDLDSATLYWPILLGLTLVGALFQFLTTRRRG